MPHPRKLIRKAVAAQLAGATAAESRVYTTRVIPHRQTKLPAVSVFTLSERVDTDTDSAPRELERSLELVVEGAIQANGVDNVDDALDDFAEQMELALHADPSFGNTAADAVLAGTEIEVLEDGDRHIGVVKLTYEVTYFAYTTPVQELADFRTASIAHNPGGTVHPNDQARDVVGLPEI